MKKVIWLFLLAMVIYPMPGWVQDIIVYGYDEDYPPWEKNVKGVPTGINIDIMTIVAERLDMGIRFEPYPFKRVLALLKNGDIDIAGGLEKRPERAMFADFLKPAYQKTKKVFVMKKGSTKVLKEYEDLYQLKIGLRAGTMHFEPFDSDEYITKVETNSDDQLFNMLLFDRYDAAVGGKIQLLYAAKANGYTDKIQIADYRLDLGAGGHFAFSRKSSFIPHKVVIEAILLDMFNSGQIDAIIASYLK